MEFDYKRSFLKFLWLMNLSISLTNSTKYCQFRHLNNRLEGFPTGCTYVIGFLDISLNQVNVNDEHFFTILDNIEYVTEYIRIFGSFQSPRVFSMKKLRVIYGYRLHNEKYSLIFDQVENNVNGMDFRSLREISRGDVGFIKNFEFCNAPRMIKWSEILENPTKQTVVHVENPMRQYKCTEEKKNVKINCHAKCDKLDGQSYCYGPAEEQCQKKNKCTLKKYAYNNSRCGFDSADSKYPETICYYQCSGGCNYVPNIVPAVCYACKYYTYKGECLHQCPLNTFHLWPSLCVDACPKNLMTEDNRFCVNRCLKGNTNEGGVCKKCGDEGCPSTCELVHPNGDHIERLTRTTLLSLRNCTRLIGSIVIDGLSFRRDSVTTVDDFMALSNLKRIEGILVIDLAGIPARLKNHEKFKSLFFLENLEEVDGIQTDTVMQFSQGFYGTPFVYLGLKSLRKFNAEGLGFSDNKNLKYINTVKWNKLGVDKVGADKVNDAQCDPKCDPECGCWGPGPEMCVRKCY